MGAQIFEALGISHIVIDRHFPNTTSKLSGLTLEDMTKEVRLRHEAAFQSKKVVLETGSDFQWRHGGEVHLFQRKTIHLLQHAVRSGKYEILKEYTTLLNEEISRQTTLRGSLEFNDNSILYRLKKLNQLNRFLKDLKQGPCHMDQSAKRLMKQLRLQ